MKFINIVGQKNYLNCGATKCPKPPPMSEVTSVYGTDNAKKITSVGLSYKVVILYSKIFSVLDVVYLKSNSISCEFSSLSVMATL